MIDSIYACMLGEHPWGHFANQLRTLLPNGTAILMYHDAAARHGAFFFNAGFDVACEEAYRNHYSKINPWMAGATTRPLGRAVCADAMLPRDRLERSEFFTDYLRPRDLSSGIGVTVAREHRVNFMVSVLGARADERAYRDAAMRLQALVPHLTRAFRHIRTRCGAADGSAVADALGLGVIQIGAGRRVSAMNDAATALLDESRAVAVDRAGRLTCRNQDLCAYVDIVLANWMRDEPRTPPRTFLLRVGRSNSTVRITVIAPSHDRAVEYFHGPECILVLERSRHALAGAVEEFSRRHALTRAETQIVAGIADGYTLEQLAARRGRSPATVRSQLKQVFAKTDTTRQLDLARKIIGMA